MTISLTLPANCDINALSVISKLKRVAEVQETDNEVPTSNAIVASNNTAATTVTNTTLFQRTDQPLNTLLGLPVELQEKIYRHLLELEPSVSDPLDVLKFGRGVPNMLLVCKWITMLAAPIAYRMRLYAIAWSVNDQGGGQQAPIHGRGSVQQVQIQVQDDGSGGGQQMQQPYAAMGGVNGVLAALGFRRRGW